MRHKESKSTDSWLKFMEGKIIDDDSAGHPLYSLNLFMQSGLNQLVIGCYGFFRGKKGIYYEYLLSDVNRRTPCRRFYTVKEEVSRSASPTSVLAFGELANMEKDSEDKFFLPSYLKDETGLER